jgi:hypothetical protein
VTSACINFQTEDPEEKNKKAVEAAKRINQKGIKELKHFDHPLNTKVDSKWKKFYDDKELWEEIEKDVKRTRVELAFFMQAVNPDKNSEEDIKRLEMQAHVRKCDL